MRPFHSRRHKKVMAVRSRRHFTQHDVADFKEGEHSALYDKLGVHLASVGSRQGAHFAVWAPHAREIEVIGDFNAWSRGQNALYKRKDHSGIWEGFIPGVMAGQEYRYLITPTKGKKKLQKIDPFAFSYHIPPHMNSVVTDLKYQWHDRTWMKRRHSSQGRAKPMSVYEMHLGSWRKPHDRADGFLSYRETADQLASHLQDLGFTHVEFMPVMEHPYFGSWGYQSLGYFAPTSRFGSPQDFMYLIDSLHQRGIGVILDWSPAHFPNDEIGLANFDGTRLFEMDDIHPDWNSRIFNIGRNEVVSFLISSALFWFDRYHIDGIRVDAVASMLYLDYSRAPGRWKPNFFGGRENLESVAFLRKLNEAVLEKFPDGLMIAEESTAWRDVSRPSSSGGLSFDMKWNMGWMHDSLQYIVKGENERLRDIGIITHCFDYAFSENYCLPLSHDEVVHQKASLLSKMPGNEKQKFSNLKLLYGLMFAHPGKKLLFMGAEIGQWSEWKHDGALDWHLLRHDRHQGIYKWLKDLNSFYKNEPALYDQDTSPRSLDWCDQGQRKTGVIAFMRQSRSKDRLLCVFNFSNRKKPDYKIEVRGPGQWKVVLDSTDKKYHGASVLSKKIIKARQESGKQKGYFLSIDIPALSVLYLKSVGA